jgi:hypothetical protein
MVKKMKGGEMTEEQKQMLANLATKGLTYGAKKFAKSDMGQELGGLASNALSSGFNWLFGNGQSGGVGVGGAKGDQRRFLANRAVPNRVPNSVRVREMNDVKNYNRNQQQRVFDMSKRQVQSESESIKPIDAKDAGAAFKLQTYISKLQQILGQKADLFSQLQASPFTDLNQLKGTTKQAGLLTMMTSKAELVQAYNEMVAYVALFFKDIQLDNRVRDRMYAAYFQPLIDQMRQLSQQYPSLFETLPAPERGRAQQPDTRQGKVYDLARKELRDMYSLLNVAADNIQDGIFRPIGPKDVAEYSRDNNVNATFSANPPPPGPIIPSLASQQAQTQVNLAQQITEGNQRAAMAQAAEIAAQNPYDPRGDLSLSPQEQASYANLQRRTRTTDRVFPIRDANQLDQDLRAGTMEVQEALSLMGNYIGMGMLLGAPVSMAAVEETEQQIGAGNPRPLMDLYDSVLPRIQVYNDWVISRGVLAPPGDAPQPASPRPQPAPQPGGDPQPGGAPALPIATADEIDTAVLAFVANSRFPTDERLPDADSGAEGSRWRPLFNIERELATSFNKRASTIKQIKQAIGRYNATIPKKKPGKKPKTPAQPQPGQAGPAPVAAPNYDSFNIAQNNSAEARAVISAILRAEEQKGSLLDSQSQTDANSALDILERDNRNAFDTIMASQGDDKALVRMDVFLPMMAAINSAKRAASRADNRPDGDYVGLGFFDSSYSGAKESTDRMIADMAEKKSKQEEKERRRKKKQEETGWMPVDFDKPIEFDSDGDYEGRDWLLGRGLRSHQNMRGRSGRELDFVPAKALNSAAPPVSMGYGSQHRPRFAWEQEEERAGGRYVRQDRVPYNLHGGLGMVNPDAEIGAYQVLHRAGEVGHRVSGGVYLPKEYIVQPAGEKEFFGYGVDGDNDVFGMEGGYGSLKRRLAGGMVNPFANDRDYHYKPKETGYDDAMDFAYGNHEEPLEGAQQAHEEEEEKPVDLDENPNPFRVRNENYKVNTGKMKKVSYKMPDK